MVGGNDDISGVNGVIVDLIRSSVHCIYEGLRASYIA